MLTDRSIMKRTAFLLPLAMVATYATVTVRAQQSPSTTPTTGAAAPATVQTVAYAPAQTVQYYQPTQAVQYYQPTQTIQYYQPTQTVQYYQPAQTVQYQQPTQTVQYQQQPAAAATGGDAYGFTNWLNGVRAQYGLSPVGYDPNLEAWAQQNNSQQNARGIGHFVMGPARRQNSAMGGYESIGAMWMASAAHRDALLDPSISYIGLAGSGSYWTFNAY